nr:venom serine protease-like [Maniola hyperantus]
MHGSSPHLEGGRYSRFTYWLARKVQTDTLSHILLKLLISGLITAQNSIGGRFSCNLYAQAAAPTPTCTCGIRRTNRIVGGQQTDPYEFPMMAGIRYVAQDQIRCGGVIIANNYVISAAHCVAGKQPRDITVEVGVYNQVNSPLKQTLAVLSITIHPQYTSSSNYDYDIVILRTQIMQLNEYVNVVCLPFKFANWDFTGAQLTLLGWGTTSFGGPVSSVLRKVNVDVISQSSCQSRVSTLTPRQLCTYTRGKDSCQDDSGGPALYTDPQTGLLFHAGIISFGRFCASDSPGISTRITALLNWITQNAPANYCTQ